jgi:hypothetical protein
MVSQASCHGHRVGRCRVRRRAEDATRAGTLMRRRRIVAVVALAWGPPAMVPAARVRLNAIAARTRQALFAANRRETRPRPTGGEHRETGFALTRHIEFPSASRTPVILASHREQRRRCWDPQRNEAPRSMSSRGLASDRRADPGKPGSGQTRGCHRGRCVASGEPATARADSLPTGPDASPTLTRAAGEVAPSGMDRRSPIDPLPSAVRGSKLPRCRSPPRSAWGNV